jgi:hypothetical protein
VRKSPVVHFNYSCSGLDGAEERGLELVCFHEIAGRSPRVCAAASSRSKAGNIRSSAHRPPASRPCGCRSCGVPDRDRADAAKSSRAGTSAWSKDLTKAPAAQSPSIPAPTTIARRVSLKNARRASRVDITAGSCSLSDSRLSAGLPFPGPLGALGDVIRSYVRTPCTANFGAADYTTISGLRNSATLET